MALTIVSLLLLPGGAAAEDATTWTLANLSNVYGESGYQHAHKAGVLNSELDCRAACAAKSSCNSYTWTPGVQPGKEGCPYVHNCWWRADTVWDLKDTAKCLGVSGYKGVPPPQPSPSPSPPSPGPPAPPAPPPSPAPAGALNVLFVIFDDLRVMHKPWGFNQTHTPNTDAFAAKSLAFDNVSS